VWLLPPSTAGHNILQLWYLSSFFLLFSFFIACCQRSQIGRLPYFHTWCGLSANLECRSEMCCTQLIENTGRKKNCQKYVICTPSHNFVRLYLCNEGMYRQSEKKLVKQQYLLHMSSQYGPLAAEIGCWVWGTPANFSGFRILALLLHRHRSPEVNQSLHSVWPCSRLFVLYCGNCPKDDKFRYLIPILRKLGVA